MTDAVERTGRADLHIHTVASDGTASVTAVLERVCRVLRRTGVSAAPYQGLGVTWGHELLEARLQLDDLGPLYSRMTQDVR